MKLSTKGRYGVRAMYDLALMYGQSPQSVKCIAERQGIPEAYLEQLIAPLRKAGLGLSIAQGIVNQHGGRIWAESLRRRDPAGGGRPAGGDQLHHRAVRAFRRLCDARAVGAHPQRRQRPDGRHFLAGHARRRQPEMRGESLLLPLIYVSFDYKYF